MRSLKDINWNHVYYFYEVARRSSMKEAARAMEISVPTVSAQIKSLESLLGVSLFDRRGRHLELTAEGDLLLSHAREIFEAGARLLDTVSPSAFGGYTVRVGIQETIAVHVAIDFVSRYWDLYLPFGSVQTLRESESRDLLAQVQTKKLDWAICLEPIANATLHSQKIGREDMIYCCSPSVMKTLGNRSTILRKLPHARCSFDRRLNQILSDNLARKDIYPEEVVEFDHLEMCLNLTLKGRAVMALPQSTVQYASYRDQLATFEPPSPVRMDFYVVWRKGDDRMVSVEKLKELLNSH